jgi:hypothetical protein
MLLDHYSDIMKHETGTAPARVVMLIHGTSAALWTTATRRKSAGQQT